MKFAKQNEGEGKEYITLQKGQWANLILIDGYLRNPWTSLNCILQWYKGLIVIQKMKMILSTEIW